MPATVEHINKYFQEAKYAVRGEVPTIAAEIAEELKDPEKARNYDFNKVIFCNLGNPQKLGQKPIDFCREVVSLVLDQELMETHPEFFHAESVERAREIVASSPCVQAHGYSDVQGLRYVRGQVARFIEQRDGFRSGSISCDDVFLSDGASTAIKLVLSTLIDRDRPENIGFMIPVPQYPLYSAAITCLGGNIVPFFLNEGATWAVDMADAERVYAQRTREGKDIRAMVAINPGNPTGAVLDEECIMSIIDFASRHGLVLLADEVYQRNIYKEAKRFVSFQLVASKWEKSHPTLPKPRIVSFHSSSKGVTGECGQRGGYCVMSGFGSEADQFRELLRTAWSQNTCPNIVGQCVLSTMVAPPTSGSAAVVDKEQKETIFASLRRRAQMATRVFNNAAIGLESQEVEGALYAFPKLLLPAKFVEEADNLSEAPDTLYAKRLVRETGLVVVPGSGFLQRDGTFHIRTSILPQEPDFKVFLETFVRFHKSIVDKYK